MDKSELETQETRVKASLKSGRWWVLLIGTIILMGLVGTLARQLILNSQGPIERGLAPELALQTFSGEQLNLSEFRGKVVVINFWASWCIPCRDEAPLLEQAWQQYQDQDVTFIGIAYLDTDKESLAFLNEFQVSYPNGPDVGTKIARDYRIRGVPETFFIGKNGQIADLEIGPLTETRLIEAIELASRAN